MAADKVIFRRWKDTQTIIALFPEIPEGNRLQYVQSFEHIGQHGAADYQIVLNQTIPAKLSESDVQDLIRELESRGYTLRVGKRKDKWDDAVRMRRIQEMNAALRE